jgi:hypothetical protein
MSTAQAGTAAKLHKKPKPVINLSVKAQFLKLLARPKGATYAELIAMSGWQAHSVRAFLSGLRKKDCQLDRAVRKTGEGAYFLAQYSVAKNKGSAS